MKCVYKFCVKGKLKIAENRTIRHGHATYFLDTDQGLLTSIRVVQSLPSKDEWPNYTRDAQTGKTTLNLNNHRMIFQQLEMRALGGFLSLFGLEGIESDTPEIEWLPESEAERKELAVTSFKETRETIELRPTSIPFDVMARSVIASWSLQEIELPLNFFRRGRLAIMERRFIDAIYQFYFIFETLFGNGRTRTRAIMAEFKKSSEFKHAVSEFLKFPSEFYPDRQLLKRATDKFGTHNVESLIDYVVEKRGFLHHHTSKGRNTWHPSYQHEYEVDALMYQDIAFTVTLGLSFKYLEKEDVVNAFSKMLKET